MKNYIGEIRAFAFNMIPEGWVPCNGQELPIKSNEALYTLLGVAYGGNGTTTFRLPNLQGRAMVHSGSYPIDSSIPVRYTRGQAGGVESVTLQPATVPPHTHSFGVVKAVGTTVLAADPPKPQYLAATPEIPQINNEGINAFLPLDGLSTRVQLPVNTIGTAGQGQAHENRMPYLPVLLCIAIKGTFPTRP